MQVHGVCYLGIEGGIVLRIPELCHEILYHPVERLTVQPAVLRELKEVVAVLRCLVVQLHRDVALGGVNCHEGTVVGALSIKR